MDSPLDPFDRTAGDPWGPAGCPRSVWEAEECDVACEFCGEPSAHRDVPICGYCAAKADAAEAAEVG